MLPAVLPVGVPAVLTIVRPGAEATTTVATALSQVTGTVAGMVQFW